MKSGREAIRCRTCDRERDPSAEGCRWCGTLVRAARCEAHPSNLASAACVACGVRVCADCRHGGRHAALCERHARLRVVQGWAEVLRTSHEERAEVLAGALRAAGVPAQVLSQKDHANVMTFGALAVVRLLVPAFELDSALRVLQGAGPDGREARA